MSTVRTTDGRQITGLAVPGRAGETVVLPANGERVWRAFEPKSPPLERRFWLSTHRDVHDTARGKAVRGWLRQLVEDRRTDLIPFRAADGVT